MHPHVRAIVQPGVLAVNTPVARRRAGTTVASLLHPAIHVYDADASVTGLPRAGFAEVRTDEVPATSELEAVRP